MYHIFSIHSFVDGHLGCFHVLAIVNSAATNIGVHVSFQIIVLSGYMPRSGIAGCYVSPRLLKLQNGRKCSVYQNKVVRMSPGQGTAPVLVCLRGRGKEVAFHGSH